MQNPANISWTWSQLNNEIYRCCVENNLIWSHIAVKSFLIFLQWVQTNFHKSHTGVLYLKPLYKKKKQPENPCLYQGWGQMYPGYVSFLLLHQPPNIPSGDTLESWKFGRWSKTSLPMEKVNNAAKDPASLVTPKSRVMEVTLKGNSG